ncbi:sensor histidine kinase [Catenuloplanes sp. NPDC051500]|uniref:sensor histidine kinase n=1 Tax=Catenuloplanes sp. NPDC051500 TaxID=3363959 RepID=UPI003795F971
MRTGRTDAQQQLRGLNLTTGVPILLAAGALLVATDADTWWQALILTANLLVALLAFERWAAHDFDRVLVPCLIVTALVWPLGVLWLDAPNAYYGLAIVGAHAVPQAPRFRITAAAALIGYVGLAGALRLLVAPWDAGDLLIPYLVLPVGVTAVMTGFMFPNKGFYDVVRELEEGRDREAELAVTRERVRFAGDLHDIQGHTLHVVKLKVTLAQKLVHTDPDRAAAELREIHALVSDTITQTKELAYAQRRLNLSAELENAKNLFEAAGIRVHVDRASPDGGIAHELLSQVLRETTTNILRHAQATEVHITLTGAGITIVNDGARPVSGGPELRGLSTLRQRLADEGGALTVAQSGGRFSTAATAPEGRSPVPEENR